MTTPESEAPNVNQQTHRSPGPGFSLLDLGDISTILPPVQHMASRTAEKRKAKESEYEEMLKGVAANVGRRIAQAANSGFDAVDVRLKKADQSAPRDVTRDMATLLREAGYRVEVKRDTLTISWPSGL